MQKCKYHHETSYSVLDIIPNFSNMFVSIELYVFLAIVESIYCPKDYQFYNGSCFEIHNEALTFAEAETECNRLPDGHLAAYHSKNEKDFLLAFARYGKSIEYIVEIIIVKPSKRCALSHTETGTPEKSYFGCQLK